MRIPKSAMSFALLATCSNTVMGHQECRPTALIYRGPATCDGCPESIASRLESSASHFEVKFAGPNEEVDISAESLKDVQLYVQPGGGGKYYLEIKIIPIHSLLYVLFHRFRSSMEKD